MYFVIMTDITQMLYQMQQGDTAAAEQLMPLVYDELRKLAARRLTHEKPGQTLQATALVHEAFIRLVDGKQAQRWNGREHFFAAAAEAMRRILIENARRKQTQKRGGGLQPVEIELAEIPTRMTSAELIDLDDALKELERLDPVKARLVTLRYFGGMTIEQAAQALAISRVTAHRYWVFARAWLYQRLDAK